MTKKLRHPLYRLRIKLPSGGYTTRYARHTSTSAYTDIRGTTIKLSPDDERRPATAREIQDYEDAEDDD
jgi:hypothetical protein